jgi:hypothetical protein
VIQLAGSVAIIITATLATACPIVYGAFHKWWRAPGSRHLFWFMAVVALVLDLWSLRLVIPDGDWFLIVRLGAFTLLPWVFGWRLLIIVKAVLAERRERKEYGSR